MKLNNLKEVRDMIAHKIFNFIVAEENSNSSAKKLKGVYLLWQASL